MHPGASNCVAYGFLRVERQLSDSPGCRPVENALETAIENRRPGPWLFLDEILFDLAGLSRFSRYWRRAKEFETCGAG